MMKEALFYEKTSSGRVECRLCRFNCRIADGKRGVCGVRENRSGKLYSLNYDRIIANNIDPVEKKPLFNFYPGSRTLSIATMGCNLRCLHCQNSDISQPPRYNRTGEIPGQIISPDEIVQEALDARVSSISYTYTEPTIFFELAYDTARLASERGLKNIFVSNGYMSREALQLINGYLDAANIDLKSFNPEHYRKICGARLEGVLDSLRFIKELDIWLEVTTLVIPGYNDSPAELRQIAHFIANELGVETPWHVTAFYPTYKLLDVTRTDVKTLRMAREIGLEAGLHYVYEGNVPGEGGENSFCHNCGEILIKRVGYRIEFNVIEESHCPNCKSRVAGRGLS